MGLELARFGAPVVAAFSQMALYPVGGFVTYGDTREGYFAAIEAALGRQASLDSIVEAFRWTHFVHYATAVDISDVVPDARCEEVPPWRVPKSQETIVRVLVDGVDLASLNMASLETHDVARGEEREAINIALRRFFHFFMCGEDRVDVPEDTVNQFVSINARNPSRSPPLLRRLSIVMEADSRALSNVLQS
jgi:hypothetical protein